MIDSAISNGAKGIVIAGSGAGSTSSDFSQAIGSALDQGVPVVFSTRTGSGAVVPRTEGISSGFLNPPKSRIQLQLAIATGMDFNATKASFEKVLGDYLA
jgi:L-asparaginase